ncbi:MAG: DegV family EDD domain-containing protein [Gemmatimonadetes bacterium]|nr:DegV family EDD domain-containing protein [Gemmatimonadota bacterium]
MDAARDELNRINVFPVPDGDTGTNFSLTLHAVASAVRRLRGASLPAVTRAMVDGCIVGARGNSGMLLSQFLLGFRNAIGDRETAGPADLARAMRAGSDQLAASLDDPVEGTILTVARAVAEAAERATRLTERIDEFMHYVLAGARAALERTPELLAVLREAGVVDAGAKAFVRALEGIMRLIEGHPLHWARRRAPPEPASAAALAQVAQERDYQFCTEVLVRGSALPAATSVRAGLRSLGGSIVVLADGDLLRVHVHTDQPEAVFALAQGWGVIASRKAEDVREQHRRLARVHRPVAVVVDSSCDLPDDLADRVGLIIVPLQVIENGRVYLDRVDITSPELYRRMRREQALFTTSQPAPGAFRQAFLDAQAQGEEVLALILSGALSGTYASAAAVARGPGFAGVTVFDSRTTSLALGLLALRATELAERGMRAPAIVEELRRIRQRSGLLFTLDTFEHVLRSGRIGRARAWIGEWLDLKPILELNHEGVIAPLDRVRGRERLIPRVLEHLERRLTPVPERVRFGIVHADAVDAAAELEAEVRRRYHPLDCLVQPITAALGAHTGPGAWGVCYQVE